MNRIFSPGTPLAFLIAVCTMTPVWAGEFYISSELGMNFGESLDLTGSSNDRASICDGYINPNFEAAHGYEGANCTGPNRGATGDWKNRFSSDDGILFGAALGYRMRDPRFRMELEYFYRDTGYDETSDVIRGAGESGDKLEQEIVRATDTLDSMTSHNLFANMYVDFASDSKFTPYLGVGVGFGFTEVDHTSVWTRNSDVSRITTGAGLSNADEIQANLTGRTSVARVKLDDTLFGYQLIAGVDYALTDSLTLGVKGRWVDFDSLSDDGLVWDPLRGHAPYLRTPEQASGAAREPVSGRIKLDDIGMFAISVNLKYYL